VWNLKGKGFNAGHDTKRNHDKKGSAHLLQEEDWLINLLFLYIKIETFIDSSIAEI
jgi:hypothetical protein